MVEMDVAVHQPVGIVRATLGVVQDDGWRGLTPLPSFLEVVKEGQQVICLRACLTQSILAMNASTYILCTYLAIAYRYIHVGGRYTTYGFILVLGQIYTGLSVCVHLSCSPKRSVIMYVQIYYTYLLTTLTQFIDGGSMRDPCRSPNHRPHGGPPSTLKIGRAHV